MLYLANPCTQDIRDAMADGLLGAIMSPRQGNQLPPAAIFAIDNNWVPAVTASRHRLPRR
jgi:hypothetical protein